MLASNLYWLEFKGHSSTILASSVAMFLTSLFSSVIGTAAHDIVTASTEGLSAWFVPLAAIVMTTLPATLAALGVYAITDASEGVLRYEAGLYSSQGVDSSLLAGVWSVTLGLIPIVSYAVGVVTYVSLTSGSSFNVEILLPFIVSGAVTLLAVERKLKSVFDTAPFVTIKFG